MKKAISITIVIALCFAIAGCNNDSQAPNSSSSSVDYSKYIPEGYKAITIGALETYIPEKWLLESRSETVLLDMYSYEGVSFDDASLAVMQINDDSYKPNMTPSQVETAFAESIDKTLIGNESLVTLDFDMDKDVWSQLYTTTSATGVTYGCYLYYDGHAYAYTFHNRGSDVENPTINMEIYTHPVISS